MIIVLMEGRDFWIRYSCTYMYSNEQSVKQKQKIMVIIYEEQRHFLDILIILIWVFRSCKRLSIQYCCNNAVDVLL